MSDDELTVNSAAGPGHGPAADFAMVKQMVKAQAELDAASGGYDLDGVQAMEGPLPAERWIDRMLNRFREENEQHAADADSFDRIEHTRLERGPEVPATSDGDQRENLAALEAQQERELKALDKAGEELAAATSALEGEIPWRDGSSRTGAVPATPALTAKERRSVTAAKRAVRWRTAALKQWFIDLGFSLSGALPEYAILMAVFLVALRTDNLFEVGATAFGIMLLCVGAPHAAGVQLNALVKGTTRRATAYTVLAIAIPFWIAGAAVVAKLRTDTERTRTIQRVANELTISPDQVDLTGRFDSFSQFTTWFLLVLSIGVFVMLMKLTYANPAISSAIKQQNRIAVGQVRLGNLEARIDRIRGLLQLNAEVAEGTQRKFAQAPAVLEALRTELKALYRVTLINALANPPMTGYLASPDEEAQR